MIRATKVMAKESEFVAIAQAAASEILSPPLSVQRGKSLFYQITVDNDLSLTVDPKRPIRGQSAFQTDLCVFEEKKPDVSIPRVVMEFKGGLTTHDVLTYSAKARKHKQVYPYLRYGLVVSEENFVPGRLFTHNEALDFCATLGAFRGARLREVLASLLLEEIEASRQLERIGFGQVRAHIFRTEIVLRTST
jgi:hypothetical protein